MQNKDSEFIRNFQTIRIEFLKPFYTLATAESKQLAIRLFKTLKEKHISVRRFAADSGIPLDRIYKWKQQDSGPGLEDFAIIKNWIDNGTYPHNSEITPHPVKSSDYISELKERIQELKQDKEDLKREKETLYRLIDSNLAALAASQQITQAQLKASIKWHVEQAAGKDQKKAIQELAKINTLVGAYLPEDDGAGKHPAGI